jgi:hypothetical protein
MNISPDRVIRRALALAQPCPFCCVEAGKPCMGPNGETWRGHCVFCGQAGSYCFHPPRWRRIPPLVALAHVGMSIVGLPRICYSRAPDHLPNCPKMIGGRALEAAREKVGI